MLIKKLIIIAKDSFKMLEFIFLLLDSIDAMLVEPDYFSGFSYRLHTPLIKRYDENALYSLFLKL